MSVLRELKYRILLGIILTAVLGFAQGNFSNFQTKKIALSDSVQLDSLSIIPNSLIIPLDSSGYEIDYFKGFIKFYNPSSDSISVSYKTFPLNFTSVVQQRSPFDNQQQKKKTILTKNPYSFGSQELSRNDLFGSSSLQKGGSISRGVNLGNTRDLSVNSNLNLQLSGTFQGVEILASVTDNNIPIQPQGNTQTLQDFDKVFIQFSKDGHKLLAGDFQTIEKDDIFLKYNKKAQGLSYSGKYDTRLFGKKAVLDVKTDVALSRGKFNRQSILGIEGNQGPYQLVGAENERFIIILSGTERVYIDGKLLSRGMDGDYIIDYNTAEITFTTNQLITKDKRIIVEFQYSDQNYGRSLFTSSNNIKNEKGNFFVNFYSEQDMRFQQLQQTLSNEQLDILSAVGDSLQFAVSPRIDTVEFTNTQVLYKQSDTIIDAVTYSYFEYSTDPDSAIYALGFSNVGDGNGNYIQATSTANGRVFEWVAPIGGLKQGNYEPVTQLIAPKQQQMLTLGGNYKLNKKNTLFVEAAFSNQNQNLFSDKNKEDDQGLAIKTSLKRNLTIKAKSKDGNPKIWKYSNNFNYQIINKNFRTIERFRSVEFSRDFNIGSVNPNTTEQTFGWDWAQNLNGKKAAGLNVSYIDRRNEYFGFKSALSLDKPLWKGANINGTGSYLQSEGQVQGSEFIRHLFTLTQKVNKTVSIKIWEEEEFNPIKNLEPDTLASNSFRYTVLGSEINFAKSDKITFNINGNQRLDWLPNNNQLQKVTTANNAGAKFNYNGRRGSKFFWSSTFRELTINNSELVNQDPENTFLNRIDYKFQLWKGMVNSSSFFEIASGSELRRQFQYIEVNPGQGIYTWIDYNNDSIQDLNEFEVAQFVDQANYVRVFLPTTDFIKTYTNQFNQSLNINPAKYFKRDKKFKKFLTRFNNQFLMKLNQKISKDQSRIIQVPFQGNLNDTNLISVSSSLRNTIYFNRSNPIYGINYTVRTNQSKNLLTSGFEARDLLSNAVDFRWNIVKTFTFRNKAEISTKGRSSELFSANDYQIEIYNLEPKLSYQKGSRFRTSLNSEIKNKSNLPEFGGEFTQFRKIGIELNYNLISKGRFTAGTDYISTTFSGDQEGSSPLLFDMLEGFQIGTNYTWNASFQRSFKNNLQLSLRYEGRASEAARTVHTGNMTVQLMF